MSEMFQLDKTQARAYLMINCESGAEVHVLDEIRTFPEIKESTLTIGRHDILALVQASTPDELRDVISMKVRKIPEVRCTTTLVCTESGA
ncbi:MAG: Lrp/AsnC ligand binding domain-containing protein [Thaumarchaeota archaeon]|nr:Lrp/AsnC ligand binding domain-containing protein [Nitrososphaerota archaeon]